MRAIRAAIYCRVSTKRQSEADKISIPQQIEKCKDLVKENGWTLAQTETDPGYSSNTLNRPGLQNLLKNVGRFDVLVIYDPDRLSRDNALVEATIYNELDNHRIQVTSVSQPLPIVSPNEYDPRENDTIYIQRRVSGLAGGLDNRRRTRRLMAGLQAKQKNGFMVKPRAYGYAVRYEQVGENGKPRLLRKTVIVEEEAATVRAIFQDYISGLSTYSIAWGLNRDRILSKNGKLWSSATVRDLLHNPVYCGKVRMNYTPRKNGKMYRSPRSEWILSDGKHEPIIDEQTYKQTQIVFERKARKHRAVGSSKLLSGLVKCGFCRWSMTSEGSHTPKKSGKYSCGKYKTTGTCQRNPILISELEDAVIRDIHKLLDEPSLIKKLERNRRGEDVAEIKQGIKRLENKLKLYPTRRSRLFELYETKAITRGGFLDRKEELAMEEKHILKEVVKARGLLEKVSTRKITLEMMQKALANFVQNFDKHDTMRRKQALRSLIQTVEVKNRILSVNFRFSSATE